MGRIDVLNNHLCNCTHVPPTVQSKAKASKTPNVIVLDDDSGTVELRMCVTKKHSRNESSSSARSTEQAAKKQRAFQIIAAKSIPFSESMQKEFEDQLLRAFVSSGMAFNKIEDPEFQQLFTKFIPGALVPSRQRLESKILQCAVVQLEGEVKVTVKGSYATLSCDGWKDVSRKHLVAFMITANREVEFISFIWVFC